jgi:predicted MPP superfamily phosphohydrolase
VAFISRRTFLRTSPAAFGAAAGVGLYTWRAEPHWVEFVRRQLPIANLPASLAGRTLVQLSDVHVGPRVDDDYVIDTFRKVAALKPDLVVMTGDFISHSATVFDQVAAVYRHFPTGRLATLAILGNHDYGPGWSHPEIAARIVEAVAPFGVTVLRNQVHEVEGLQVAGLDDWWAHRFAAAAPLQQLDVTRAAIVLSHNPDTADLPVWSGYQGWILSGHTHGGQCKPPFLPPPLVPVLNRRYTAGEFDLTAGRRLYINRGVGYLLRVRFNVRPEVTVHELTRV